jgi:hypothetical protein
MTESALMTTYRLTWEPTGERYLVDARSEGDARAALRRATGRAGRYVLVEVLQPA